MPLRAWSAEKHHRHPSLFGELVDWMVAPLLILWPLSMAIEYSLAFGVASAAYDRELKDSVLVVARHLAVRDGRIRLDLREPGREVLLADEITRVVFQVRDAGGAVVEGERLLPGVDYTPDLLPNEVYFRDDRLGPEDVRVAYVFAQVRGLAGAALVQMAETEEKRTLLASRIIGGVLAAQFIILPLALVLAGFGLRRGIAPLDQLAKKLRERGSHDLSPINRGEAPEEVRPFVDAMNDLMARLEASLRAQQRFVSDAAHQMRTPLAGLRTQAEFAMRQRDLDGLRHSIGQIAAGAEQASRLVSQMLSLARAEAGATRLEPLEIGSLVEAVTREWVPAAIARGLDLGYEPPPESVFVEGNPTLLHELFANLLDNAVRYSMAGGRVTVRLRAAERVEVDVEDDGIGIDAAERELVFERFYRVLGTHVEGTGLGLAIVREVAQAHQASVRILERGSGRGTLVRVTFARRTATVTDLRAA